MIVKKFVWFVLGLAGGFVLAHLVDKDPRGHELMGQVDARIGEFTDRIGDAYREQEAQLAGLVAEARDVAAGTIAAAKDAASEAVEAAKTVISEASDSAADVAPSGADAAENAAPKPTD